MILDNSTKNLRFVGDIVVFLWYNGRKLSRDPGARRKDVAVMPMQYCTKCMEKRFPGVSVCPHCGTPYHHAPTRKNALEPGHLLAGKYRVGQVLGQGGFGITYIGIDQLLEKKVAIKEYFSTATGTLRRDESGNVIWRSSVNNDCLNSFLREARKMARAESIPCVVRVRDYFYENNTAYIVMDYIQGQTLAEKLQKEGPMGFGACVSLLTPVIQALSDVHALGIIHRDISPDNIMLQPDGTPRLLDLGAAKEIDSSGGGAQSSQLITKDGFSPLEQYTLNGGIGTWTDVYSMCATIYYCCTGELPPLPTERVKTDGFVCPASLHEREFAVLKQGMAVQQKDRIKTMGELLNRLQKVSGRISHIPTPNPNPKPNPEPGNDRAAKSKAPLAALIFGLEIPAQLLIWSFLGAGSLLMLPGYALLAGGLLPAKPNRKLFAAGCALVCLAGILSGSLSGPVLGLAMGLCLWLLLSDVRRLQKYKTIPIAVFCVYLIMFLVEFLSIAALIPEGLACYALLLALQEFS